MELTGKLFKKFETKQVNEKFTKREFVMLDDAKPEYPQYITFQLLKDKVNLIDSINEGDTIKVDFYVQGREWTNQDGKVMYFNSLNAWKVTKAEQEQAVEPVTITPEEVETEEMPF